MTKLIALVVIAAGTVAAVTQDIPAGASFDAKPDDAEPLLTLGLAKLADPLLTDSGKKVKVRVLVACAYGQPDDVVSLAPDVARQAQEAGQVDTNKAAVAYAQGLAKPTAE